MKTLIWIPVAAVLVVGMALPGIAAAGGNPEAVLALHAGPRAAKNACQTALPSSCTEYSTSVGGTGFYDLYLTVSNYDSLGIAGLQFGIDYDGGSGTGCDVGIWYSCADLEFAQDNWPDANTGNLMTWDYAGTCQGDEALTPILAGIFQVTAYSGDTFSLTPRPVDGKAKVADCLLAEDDITGMSPSRLGVVAFGTGTGFNPCEITVPVRRTTWGGIKSLFEN